MLVHIVRRDISLWDSSTACTKPVQIGENNLLCHHEVKMQKRKATISEENKGSLYSRPGISNTESQDVPFCVSCEEPLECYMQQHCNVTLHFSVQVLTLSLINDKVFGYVKRCSLTCNRPSPRWANVDPWSTKFPFLVAKSFHTNN